MRSHLSLINQVLDQSGTQLAASAQMSVDAIEEEESSEDDENEDDDNGFIVDEDSLLGRARQAKMPVLYANSDPKVQRLYSAMLQRTAFVQVDLPNFVRQMPAVAPVIPSRNDLQRFWRGQRVFGWVKQTDKCPSPDGLRGWMEQRLRIPQAAYSMDSPWLFNGEIIFPRVREVVQNYYDQCGERRPAKFKGSDLKEVAKWVVGRKDDAALAWLIFFVTQFPAYGVGSVIRRIDPQAVGPLSNEALEYFIDCAEACAEANARRRDVGRAFGQIRRTRPAKPVVEEKTIPVPLPAVLAAVIPAPQTTPVVIPTPRPVVAIKAAAATTVSVETSDPFMNTKLEIQALLDGLTLGMAEFDATLATISDKLATLRTLNAEVVAERERAAVAQQRVQERIEAANALAASVAETLAGHPDWTSGEVSTMLVDAQNLAAAEASLQSVQVALDAFNLVQECLKALSERPAVTLAQRAQRNKEESQLIEQVTGHMDELVARVQSSPVLRIANAAPVVADEVIEQERSATTDMSVTDTLTETALAAEAEDKQAALTAPDVTSDVPSVEVDAADVASPASGPTADVEKTDTGAILADASNQPIVVIPSESPVTPREVQRASEIADQAIALASKAAEAQVKAKLEPAPQPKPEKAPALPPQLPHAAKEEDSEPDDNGGLDLNAVLGTLHDLVDKRRYALARVHVDAMSQILNVDFSDIHSVVLDATLKSLHSFDCRFSTDARASKELLEMLKTFPEKPNESLCHQMPLAVGIFGANLVNMLFDGPGTDTRWTVLDIVQSRFASNPALADLATHIGSIDTLGMTLTREKFSASRVGSLRAVEAEIKRMQERAANWGRDPEIFSNWNHRGFLQMHERMLKAQHPIGQCIALIEKGDGARLKMAYAQIQKRMEKPANILDDLVREIKDRKKPEGLLRTRMIENITVTRQFIETYLSLLEQRTDPNTDLGPNVQAFFDSLHKFLTAAIAEIQGTVPKHPLEAIYFLSAIRAMQLVLRLYDEKRPTMCVPDDQQLLLIQLPMGRDYQPSMRRRDMTGTESIPPVCEPLEVIEETRRLSEEVLSLEDQESDAGLIPALRDAARSHLKMGRFLPVYGIESSLPVSISAELQLAKHYVSAHTELEGELHEAMQRVVHAMALSALDKNEANRMQHIIAEISTANDGDIGKLSCTSAYPDFPHARAALRTHVLHVLDAKLSETKAKLLQEISAYEAEAEPEVRKDIERIRAMLASNGASGLHTAHDSFAMLRRDGFLPPASSDTRIAPEIFTEFLGNLKKLAGHTPPIETLRDRLATPRCDEDPEWIAVLDDDTRADAAEFLNMWIELCTSRPVSPDLLTEFVAKMGISGQPTLIRDASNATRAHFFLPEKTFAFENTDDLFIPPVLGSRANHIQGYLLHGRPRDPEIRQVVSESGSTPTFIFVHAPLNLEKRSKICREAPIILVDDDLVAYMAMQPDKRLRRLMEIGLLTFFTNPYADYGTAVPPEMFVGRRKELERLRSVTNAGVLYGGRRLGKTSLLDQIAREKRSAPGHEAVFIQMDNATAADDHVLFAWKMVYKAMVAREVIGAMPTEPMKWDVIQEWIERQLIARKVKSCYLLIDEADGLMGRELHLTSKAPSFVRGLQQLCESVQGVCSIRYVIAGLHNITRMTTEENSALGKAEVIALEPFSSSEDIRRGIQLVTRPLAALGFYFDRKSEDLPLRILSVCNFYPAFIQMYCNKLLDSLYNKRQDRRPPTYIEDGDLNGIEVDGDLLADMQRKFELNLNLDKRYKAIALILADDYYSDVDNDSERGLTVSEIQECCDVYELPHFARTGLGTYEALLDEMQKLNVLERVGSRYILRHPNIAMLMGDRERVVQQLSELSREKPTEARSHGERRMVMEQGKARALFPMPAAWIRANIDPKDDELIIFVGNAQSGIQNLFKASGEWKIGQEGYYTAVRANPRSTTTFLNGERRMASRLVAITPNAWKTSEIGDYAMIAARENLLSAKQSKRGFRLALIALPDRALELSRAIADGTLSSSPDAGRRWRVEPIPPWTDDSVFFHLNENIPVAEDSDARMALLEASCRFGDQIEHLCTSSLAVAAAKNAVSSAQKNFAPDLPTFYHKIGLPVAIDAAQRERMESFLVAVDGAERNSTVVDELMDDAGVDAGLVQFLYWMGLLQHAGNTWIVPKLYRRLLK